MRKRGCGGFSLPELLLVCALFSGFLLMVHYLLSYGLGAWQRTASSQDAGLQLSKAHKALQDDLRASGVTVVRSAPSQDALWMLSAVDPTSGQSRYRQDSTPLWQRNVLYYLTTPAQHDVMFQQSCQAEPFHCPHKILIRRVLDGADSAPPEPAEVLMEASEIESFLLAPAQLSPDVVATGLVSFEVFASHQFAGEIEFRLRAFSGEGAGKSSAPGGEDLRESPYTRELHGSVFPGN